MKAQQLPREDIDVRRWRERRRSLKQNPETSLPSVWSRTFDLNPEEPLLGGGAFAKILRVVERSGARAYAMKVMNRPNFAMRGIEAQVDAEMEAMRRCAHNNWCRHVVRMWDTAEENDYVYIRLELCSCDLLRFANAQPSGRLTEADALVWTQQLLTGLSDVHRLGILHRDIKPENLLCTADGTLKIADFGWCAELRDSPASMAGTFQYMAPEILGAMGVQTEAVDVWSSGVTMIQLLTGYQLLTTYLGPGSTALTLTDPHQATRVKTARLLAEIMEKCPPSEEARPQHISWRCWVLLQSMLVPEVELRVSVSEALGHPWLQEAPGNKKAGDLLNVSTKATSVRTRSQNEAKDGFQESAAIGSASMPILQVPTPMRAVTPARSPRQTSRQAAPSPQPSPKSLPACRRSESAPKCLHEDATPVASSRQLPSDPPSPRGALRPPPQKAVYRSQTGERCPAVDGVCTQEALDAAARLRTPVRTEHAAEGTAERPAALTEPRMTEGSGLRLVGGQADVSPLSNCQRSLRRASFAVGEESFHEAAGWSLTLRPHSRRDKSQGPVRSCQATPPASNSGSVYLPGSRVDPLSRTTPPELLKVSTPGMPPLRTWRENEPREANKSPPRARQAATDALLRSAVVMRPWSVATSMKASPASQFLASSAVVPTSERTWLSPRPFASPSGLRTTPTSLRASATPCPDAFRDVGTLRSSVVAA